MTTDNDALVQELFDHIKHGDAEHQSWLLGSLLSFFATRHVRSTPPPKPLDPPAQDEVALDAFRDAYWAGAMAVHNAWVNDLGQNDPDFGEAASDYAYSAITALRQHQSAETEALRAENARLREALRTAIGHIEHMAAWITKQGAGYSFESLGENMPDMRAALAGRQG